MRRVVIIPARYQSVRFPGKPLTPLRGQSGESKPLVQRTWDCARRFCAANEIFVATDDERIADAVRAFGGQALLTPGNCANGTERCAAAIGQLPQMPEIVINLQGDAPLTPHWFLADLEAAMHAEPAVQMATPVLRCDAQTYGLLRADRAAGRVGGTTAVFGANARALYFSKEVLPFVPDGPLPEPCPVFHHVGVYAYRPDALAAYARWPHGTLEALEGLEQLRFLENGIAVHCVEVNARGRLFWELNNPSDVGRIESVLP
ncbi:MAG: manno-octulosonate cytidylyltransferase [Paracoccaceae bacterium]